MSRSRYSASNTPDTIEVARASLVCSASTSFRFWLWNTRRTIASASGEVTRRPLTVCLSMPAAASSASSCGPAPWMTIGVSPTSCRNASDDVSASRSSRSTAPPTLTTAKRAASSCEKRLRYCEISFAPAMLESRRTMVWRVWGSWTGLWRGGFMLGAASCFKDAHDGIGVALQLFEGDPFVGGMRLGDVARAVHQRGHAGAREQRRLRPEVDGGVAVLARR